MSQDRIAPEQAARAEAMLSDLSVPPKDAVIAWLEAQPKEVLLPIHDRIHRIMEEREDRHRPKRKSHAHHPLSDNGGQEQ
jgi:hypothetical protein